MRRNGVIDCRNAFDGVDTAPVGDGNPAASTTAVAVEKNEVSEIAKVPVAQETQALDTTVLEGLVDVAAPLSGINVEPAETPAPAAQPIAQPAAVQRASAEVVDVVDSVAPEVQREQPIVERVPEEKPAEAAKPAWMAEKF